MKVEEGHYSPHLTQIDVSTKLNKSFADLLTVQDIENLLRGLYAAFFEIDPYGLKYDGVLCAIEHAVASLKMGRERNVP